MTIDTTPVSWKDLAPFYLPFVILAIMFYVDYYYRNPFIVVWLAYVVIPIADFLIPVDHFNLP